MAKNTEIKEYRPVLAPESRDDLLALAESLGFIVTRQGMYEGEPSVRDFLHALAAAYRRDPGGVHLALKVVGVYNKPDAPDPTTP